MEPSETKIYDTVLKDITNVAFAYLHDKDSANALTDVELVDSFEFLSKQFVDINKIKSVHYTMAFNTPLSNISEQLDRYQEVGTFTSATKENLHDRLSKDVDSALIQVGFCHGIYKEMITKRNIFKN